MYIHTIRTQHAPPFLQNSSAPSEMDQSQQEAYDLTDRQRPRMSAAAWFRGQASRGRLAVFALKHNEQETPPFPRLSNDSRPKEEPDGQSTATPGPRHATPASYWKSRREGTQDDERPDQASQKTASVASTPSAYDDDSLSPARLIPPKPLARKHEKNGGNPVWRKSIQYKIRCGNWRRSRPNVRLGSAADTSTEYLHQLASPQASSTAIDLNFWQPGQFDRGRGREYLPRRRCSYKERSMPYEVQCKVPERAGTSCDDGEQVPVPAELNLPEHPWIVLNPNCNFSRGAAGVV
ncbi:hypothetical protein BBK36DRAFT_16665 [Trichoderma citrinoviride]|uniref:Uncharacterized protein n=1 Tax=Trichoderma citrinoviride TaxID=58853 RepID=A0A2T4BJ02_9HYPO|nr:hypothetical protein BBK36DRAFT_16665 [Trichoderma citrinoviride]PTB69251.1 hypothetical protein BBK36DRAFT_16665 [Trichoderma citrinoviride]